MPAVFDGLFWGACVGKRGDAKVEVSHGFMEAWCVSTRGNKRLSEKTLTWPVDAAAREPRKERSFVGMDHEVVGNKKGISSWTACVRDCCVWVLHSVASEVLPPHCVQEKCTLLLLVGTTLSSLGPAKFVRVEYGTCYGSKLLCLPSYLLCACVCVCLFTGNFPAARPWASCPRWAPCTTATRTCSGEPGWSATSSWGRCS